MRKENGVYHKEFYCRDFVNRSDADRIFDVFLLSDLRYCSNDRGIKWLSVLLKDKSGEMRAKIWSDRIEMEYEGYKNQIVFVSGRVTYYAGKADLTIEKMKIARPDEIIPTEVVKMLDAEKIKGYQEQLVCLVSKIQSMELRDFTEQLITEETVARMAQFPVCLCGHHSYSGGLLAHICEVATAAFYYAKATGALRELKYDLDLVIAGALLHDIGCLLLLKKDGYVYSIDDGKKLLGSSYVTHRMLNDAYIACKKNGRKVPDTDTYGMLVHIIEASHTGIEPMTMEAMLIKRMNLLSAELERYETECISCDPYQENTQFLWSKEVKREIYKGWRKQTDDK